MADDPAWTRHVAVVTGAVATVEKRTATLWRWAAKVVTARDAKETKERLRRQAQETLADVHGLHDALKLLEGFMRLDAARGPTGMGLCRAARTALEEFEKAEMNLLRVLREKSVAGQRLPRAATDSDDGAEAEEAALVRPQQVGPQQETFRVDVYDDIMEHRSRDIQEVASNISDINDIFQHIREIVGEQGEALTTVEMQLERTEDDVRGGREELQRARRQQGTQNLKRIFLGLLLLLGLLVVVTIMLK